MAENRLTEMKTEVSESEALIDAEKTFKWTLIAAILFGLAALFIIMRTRMG